MMLVSLCLALPCFSLLPFELDFGDCIARIPAATRTFSVSILLVLYWSSHLLPFLFLRSDLHSPDSSDFDLLCIVDLYHPHEETWVHERVSLIGHFALTTCASRS